MEELQVVSELVDDLAPVTAGKYSSSGPGMWVDSLQTRCATAFTGELHLYKNETVKTARADKFVVHAVSDPLHLHGMLGD